MFNNVLELISFIEKNKRQEKRASLNGMLNYLDIFDHPEEGIKYVHIGGTNGKGSTVTYVKNILMNAGYKVGSYISPYVIKFNERIGIGNDFISDYDLLDIGNYISNKLESINVPLPAFFDFVTLIAFIYFKRLQEKGLLDIAIIEVGMGGIYDSTNVITPLVSCVTNVTYDHMSVLGNTLEEIWLNKLGILKTNVPFVTFNSEYSYLVKEENKKSNNDHNLYILEKHDISNINSNLDETVFSIPNYKDLKLNILGKYQTENAYLAVKISEILIDEYGFNITKENVYNGLLSSFWPGRLEKVNDDPLIILDGAHNIDGVTRLKEYLDLLTFDKPIRLVIAISANKEVEKMLKLFDNMGDEEILSQFSYSRSADASTLYNYSNHKNKILMENVDDVLDRIYKDKSHVNILFGSLYFVSEVRNKIVR